MYVVYPDTYASEFQDTYPHKCVSHTIENILQNTSNNLLIYCYFVMLI